MPNGVIAKRIRFIFDDIGVKYENEAVDLIASAGAGSVRDALSVADMCVSYCDSNVTYNGVLEVLGAADPKKLQSLATAIADGDTDKALQEVANLCDLGKSVPILAQDLATLFRNVLYIKIARRQRRCSPCPRLYIPRSPKWQKILDGKVYGHNENYVVARRRVQI